jgi:tetratricopeptide (TPR) repeat protein
MAGTPGVQGDALLPLVITLRDMARWFFDRGLWRLTPLFADRAAELARAAGKPHRRTWCQQERWAAFYQIVLGQPVEALGRIDYVLSQAREFLPARDTEILHAQYVRAQVLRNLGRYGEALAEIEAFAPILADVKGARHPDALITRSLRIGVEIAARQNIDHDADLREIIDELGRARGRTSRPTLSARYRLSRLLLQQGQSDAARAEVIWVIADFDPATYPAHDLLRSAKALLEMIEERTTADTLVV